MNLDLNVNLMINLGGTPLDGRACAHWIRKEVVKHVYLHQFSVFVRNWQGDHPDDAPGVFYSGLHV